MDQNDRTCSGSGRQTGEWLMKPEKDTNAKSVDSNVEAAQTIVKVDSPDDMPYEGNSLSDPPTNRVSESDQNQTSSSQK